MAITTQARRAIRVSERKQTVNVRRKRAMKTSMKHTTELARGGQTKEAAGSLSAAYKAIDKATKAGVIKKNTAARKKSRLAHTVEKAKRAQ